MAMVGAFLGGESNTIPAGKGQVFLNWITDDEKNMEGAIFKLIGTKSYQVSADSNGQANVVVDVGDYTVSVEHEGQYYGDSSKTLTVSSRETYTLTWFATAATQATVVMQSPSSFNVASYSIEKGGQVFYSGTTWNSSMTFMLYEGVYTLKLTIFGTTVEHEFEVGSNNLTLDLSSLFCRLTITGIKGSSTFSINDNQVVTTSSTQVSQYVLKTSSATISGVSNLAYSGASTSKLGTYTSKSVDLSGDTASVPLVFVGTIVTITNSRNILPPIAGNYEILVIGGGGGGGGAAGNNAGGGGGSGNIVSGTYSLGNSNYKITIGNGGSGGSKSSTATGNGSAGEASSFGTLVSASGGSGGQWEGNGGDGGAGGGGGGDSTGYGGNGSYGGGGGSAYERSPGTGGTYGGNGGAGTSSYGERAESGRTGKPTTSGTIYYGSSYSGGTGGTAASSGRSSGGGGGGGGRGARGGNGGSGLDRSKSGAGGGGGVAGGKGGNGASVNRAASAGMGGYGYGAGGGGSGGSKEWHYGSGNSIDYSGGGGGGGGVTSTKVSGNGETKGSGGSGAKGAIRLQYIG